MKISVIIPTLNEEESIVSTLEDLIFKHKPYEVIVVDGGSTDNTRKIAKKHTRVICSKAGRAAQMNVGAKEAKGDILLFLHADTKLPPGALKKIERVLKEGNKSSGRFRVGFDSKHLILQFYAFFTRFHLFSYGDQGLFIRKELFENIGGFCENVLFEDIDIYRRVLNYEKPVILNDCVITAARRFLKQGIIKQGMIDALFFFACLFGLNNKLLLPLKKWLYADVR